MSEQISSNEEALRSASFGKLARKLCIPAILIMLVNVIYHMADVFFIGKVGDNNMIAAVSLASPMFSILLGTGGCTAVSLALGRGERDQIKRISAFCLYGSVIIGVIFSVFTLLLLPTICLWLGADADTLGFTQDYLRVIAMFAPVIMFTNVAPSLIRADGSTLNSMVGNLIGTVGNIVLDPILILGLKWNVTGAAVATVLGNIAAAVYYIWFITKKGTLYAASSKLFSLKKDVVVPVISMGLPMSVSTILQSVSGAIANNLMMGYTAVALSAQSVASRIGMLISMTVMGICMGMQPAVSFNYSAKNTKRLIEIIWKTTALAVATGTILSVLAIIFRDPLILAFVDDPEAVKIGRVCLLASVIIGPIYGFYQMSTSYLQSTGKAKEALTVSLLEKGLIYIPILLIAHAIFGMYGIIFAGTVTTVLSMIVSLAFSYRTFRKDMRENNITEE